MMETVGNTEVGSPEEAVASGTSTGVLGRSRTRVQETILVIVSTLCFLFSGWAIHVGWNNSILDVHGWRQTQTAINTYYIQQTGQVLRYEMPVLGPPWSIPFEFPLYQYVVSVVSSAFHLNLEPAGRLVSAIFFYATLAAVFLLLLELKFAKRHAFAATALIAVSPHYIFWSRTFMIESTALFFSVAYLLSVLKASRNVEPGINRVWVWASLTAICGALSAMVKVTTLAPFMLAGGGILAWRAWEGRGEKRARLRSLVLCAASVVVPFVAAACWTHYADAVKAENAMGKFLTSGMLNRWNFGTMAQRLDISSYTMLGTVADDLLGSRVLLAMAAMAVVFVCRQELKMFAACLGLYASAILIFFNLYSEHSYYEYANGIFLIIAVGVAVGGSMQARGWRSSIGVLLFVLAVGLCGVRYFDGYYKLQRKNVPGRPAAAAIITANTNPSDVMLVYGLDRWHPAFAYQCRRRAILAWIGPGQEKYESGESAIGRAALQASIQKQKPENIAALVACDSRRHTGWESFARRELHFQAVQQYSADACDIYVRR